MTDQVNDHLALISGKSATGKSASLLPLKDDPNIWYLNCENGKKLPFPAKFTQYKITDPNQVYEAFQEIEKHPDVHTIIIDTLTFLMDMYETLYVNTSPDSRKAWGEYAAYWRRLMQQSVANCSKNVIFLGHTTDLLNESENVMETLVKVKGSLMNQGIESYFTTVVSSKKMPLKKLEGFENDLLNITEEEQMLGFKYVFQTRLTKETVNERIRAPMGMWDIKETYIDNNVEHLTQRLKAYYG